MSFYRKELNSANSDQPREEQAEFAKRIDLAAIGKQLVTDYVCYGIIVCDVPCRGSGYG